MTQSDTQPAQQPEVPIRAEQIRSHLLHIARRQWWLWSYAVMVTLLLTLGIASFMFPGLLGESEPFYSFHLNQAVRGLIGLVLLFNVYVVYQQLQVYRIQCQLGDQVDALGRIESRTEEVYKLAVLDELTGLYNRRSGERRLTEEISRAQRHGRPLAILLLDLNDLKQVNDKFGHAAGDEVIKRFAERLSKSTRGSDLAVRLGGDEFFVVLPECRLEDVQRVLSRLSGLKIDWERESIDITFSAGWTTYQAGESLAELMKRADDELYVQKRAQKQPSEVTLPA